MSFYGSVYYQLIDTFYKVVLRNKGINNTEFLASDNTPAWLESQAVGRKGVFGFDSGNRWINLNTYAEKSNNNEQYSIYEIYHGAPDPNADNINNGFKVHLTADELEKRKKDNVIQLAYEDEFETYETVYDDAGHIAKATKKVYKLPIAEVNEDVKILKELVGKKDGKTLPKVEDAENDSNLYGYTEQNTLDIQELQSMVGSWTAETNVKPTSVATISQAIGNFNKMLGSSYFSKDSFKSLTEVIGDMSVLWRDYDANLTSQKKSIADIILDLKERHDETSEDSNNQIEGLIQRTNQFGINIGTPWENAKSLYTYVSELLEKDTKLSEDIVNGDNAVTAAMTTITDTLAGRATSAENRLEVIEKTSIPGLQNSIKTINETTIPGLQDSIKAINETTIPAIDKRIEAHEKNWAGTQEALEQVDNDLKQADITINKKIDDNKTDILNLIGSVSEGSTVVKMVQDADNDLQNLIDGLRADLGEKGTETTAFAAIQANAADISTINQNIGTINSKIGEVSTEKSLASQISDINVNLLSYAKSNELEAYVKLTAMEEELKDYVTSKALEDKKYIAADDVATNYLTIQSAEQTYETKTTVSGISDAVDTIEGDVKTLKDGFVALGLPGDFSDKVEEGSTILESIFEKLSELEKAIADVNKRIDELHPDSNSPSGDDNGNPEDDPSLDPSDPEEDPNLNEPDNDPEQSEPGSEPIE